MTADVNASAFALVHFGLPANPPAEAAAAVAYSYGFEHVGSSHLVVETIRATHVRRDGLAPTRNAVGVSLLRRNVLLQVTVLGVKSGHATADEPS